LSIHDALSTTDAADLCGVDRRTMLRWVKSELLPAFETGGGRHRILPSELRRFMASRGMPIPAVLRPHAPCIGIVDDNRPYTQALVKFLTLALPTSAVRVAHDGFAAGVMVTESRPDVLVLDVVMPGMDGVEVVRRLRSVGPGVPVPAVIVVSGELAAPTVDQLNLLGVDGILRKPLDPDQLLALLANLGVAGAASP
jgi:excisionase family DNA binding protein